MSGKLDGFWQENKRFVLVVAAGAVLFGIGWMTLDSTLGAEQKSQRARLRSLEGQLAQPMFSADQENQAREERDRLAAAVATLRTATTFQVRPEFQAESGAASNRFFAEAAREREELSTLAGRAGLALPEGLGLPALSPTKEQEILRYLEALDLIDRAVHFAIEAQVERIEEIRIKLDPRLSSGKSIEDVEKTLIEFELVGSAAPLVRFFLLTQEGRHGNVLLVERVDLQASRAKADEARLAVAFLVAHDHSAGAALEDAETVKAEQ